MTVDKNYGTTLVVEVSREACSQLGGIYTVLRSKAPVVVERLGDRYCMLGPYIAQDAATEFEEIPPSGPFGEAVLRMRERGVGIHIGRRLITGKPLTILIDLASGAARINEYKYFLWHDHQIETGDEPEINEAVLFGYMAADFLEILSETAEKDTQTSLPVLGHFHEWMAGVPIPILKRKAIPVACVFTTHATILGRYLASADANFYEHLERIDPHAAAASLGIYPRFAIERAAAWGADCFTTVSDITAREAEFLLGKKADLLLPNGLNINRFAALHEFQNLHMKYKQSIKEFVMGHFFSSYSFDLDQTLYFFTSGRYEYRNKGIDLYIEALARLNWRMKSEGIDKTVVAFVVTRAATNGINVNVLQSKVLFDELRKTVHSITESMDRRLLEFAARGEDPNESGLLDDYDRLRMKRIRHAWRRSGMPPVCTHDMKYEGSDPVLNQLRASRLLNAKEDPVKVIYHPEFINATGTLIQIDYDQFVRGAHLGVFASYYEPWGYTPMECAALGVPAVTSDLSGFGSYIQKNLPDHESNGLFVTERSGRSFNECADRLTDIMIEIVRMSRRERIDLRNRVEAASVRFDWKELEPAYQEAHLKALSKYDEISV
jgi:glycogen(starch) synthase